MTRTRSATAKDSGQDPSDHEPDTTVDDPTQRCRAKPPKDKDEMNVWIQNTRTKLLDYLSWCRDKAHEQPTADKIGEMREALDNDWQTNWAPLTDIQTGEIYDQAVRDAMFSAMQPRVDELRKLHQDNKTNNWHLRYQKAQNYWDDFLYYQNEWNRRFYSEQPGGSTWATFLIGLYTKFEIGSRTQIPAIGPDELHQYPEGLRSLSSNPSNTRRQHLREKFPQSAVRLDHDSIEDRRGEVNEWRYRRDGFTIRELPEFLPLTRQYSAAASQDWTDNDGNEVQISWESQDWGAAVANVERVSRPADADDRPRYKTRMVRSLIRTFVWKTGKSAGKNSDKPLEEVAGGRRQFLGHYVSKMRYARHFVLDDHGRRVLEEQSLASRVVPGLSRFQAPNASNRVQGPGRQDRARLRVVAGASKDWHKENVTAGDARDAEFSDDQDGYDGLSDGESEPGLSGRGLQIEPEGELELDEGDLFALSYHGLSLPERPTDDAPVLADDQGEQENVVKLEENTSGQNKATRSTERRVTRAASKAERGSEPTADIERVSQHQPNPKAIGETFEAIPGNDEWDLATYTHIFPDGTTFTQHTRVPAFKADVTAVPGRDPPRKVYPAAGVIPADSHRTAPWSRNPDFRPSNDNKFEGVNGRWENGNDSWVPTVIVRSFRVDNNAYYNCSINPHFDAVMKGEGASRLALQEKHITKFNRSFQQVYRRSDLEVQAKLDATQCGSWTIAELDVGRALNRTLILRDGLIKWSNDWIPKHSKVLRDNINAHRLGTGTNEQERRPRTQDSVTSKFKRYFADLLSSGLELQTRNEKGEDLPSNLLKPRDVLRGSADTDEKGKPVGRASGAKSVTTKLPSAARAVASGSSTRTGKRTRASSKMQSSGKKEEEEESSDDADHVVRKGKKAKK